MLASKCYQVVLVGEENIPGSLEKKKQQELVEELKTMELVEGDTSKTTKIGMTLSLAIVDNLLSFLKGNMGVFA